jgi:hypothetical protein
MRTNRIPKILAAAVLSFFALSLTQCIVVPYRASGSSSTPGKSGVQNAPPKVNNPKPAPAPKVVYRVGQTVSVTGTLRHDGHGYYIDDENSGAVLKFSVSKSQGNSISQSLNRRIRVSLRILAVSGQVYMAELISF